MTLLDKQMEIRFAEKNDPKEINEIYNYFVLNSYSTFDTQPYPLEKRQKDFEAYQGDSPLIVTDGRENVSHEKGDNVIIKYTAVCNGDAMVINASFNRQIAPSKVTELYRGKNVSLQGLSHVVVSTDGKVLKNDLSITTEAHVEGVKIREGTNTSHRNCNKMEQE